MYKSINFSEFQKKFSTENRCIKYLIKIRWPNGFCCPYCNSKNATYIESRRLFQCNNQNCRKQTSITTGTIFEKTRTSLVKWFWMIFFFLFSILFTLFEIWIVALGGIIAIPVVFVFGRRFSNWKNHRLEKVFKENPYALEQQTGNMCRSLKGYRLVIGL